jgi:pimeloyl-ACP methyl ester carboxylesterase
MRRVSVPRPIFIHGSGGDHRVWSLQTAHLAGAVALDLPGRAGGDPATDIGTLADAVAQALEAIEPPRALIGHSLGGAVALELAIERPELVDGLVVISSSGRLAIPDATLARAGEDFAAERERLIAGSFADPAAPMARRARQALDAVGTRTLLADYATCRTVALGGRLGGVGVPVLLIVGDDDPFTPLRMSEDLARELPLSQMVVIPGARHMPMAEFDGTVTALVAAYLARLELTLQEPA